MIEADTVRLVTVYFLRGKEGFVRQLRYTIIARNICELFLLIERF